MCGSCSRGDSEAGWWEQEHQRIELARQVELAEYRLTRAEANFVAAEEHAQWLAACEAADLRATELRARKKELEGQIQAGLDQLTDYQRLAIEHRRKEMRNLEMDYLALDDRRTFFDVRVVAIDDAGVSIRHRDGSARLGIHDLSAEECLQFGIERTSALAALERERREAIAYEQQVAIDLARIEESERKSREEIAAREVVRRDAVRPLPVVAAAQSPLSQAARPFGNSYRHYDYRPTWYYRRSPYVVRTAAYRSTFCYRSSPTVVTGTDCRPSGPVIRASAGGFMVTPPIRTNTSTYCPNFP
jgi:hypothetical protein